MSPTIDALPMEEIDRLETLAKAATAGPWISLPYADDRADSVFISNNGVANLGDDIAPEDGAFIAASDPPTVLALCAQARRTVTAEAEIFHLREEIADLNLMLDACREAPEDI